MICIASLRSTKKSKFRKGKQSDQGRVSARIWISVTIAKSMTADEGHKCD